MRVQLFRVYEDGACARWDVAPEDLRIILVIPARPLRGRWEPGPDS